MPHSQVPAVRIERQPHRQAVSRLREVYHKLWQSRQEALTVKESQTKETVAEEVER